MNVIDFGLFIFVIAFVLIFYRVGFWTLLKSFIAFILAVILASICLDPLLSALSSFGWRENLYTSLIGLPFLVVIIWGVLLSLLMVVFSKNHTQTPRYVSGFLAAIFGFFVYTFLLLLVPKFITSGSVIDLDNSILYQKVKSSVMVVNFKNQFLSSITNPVVLSRSDLKEMEIPLEVVKNPTADPASADKLFSLVNLDRRSKGVADLMRDPRLDTLAENYAFEITRTRHFSHYSVSNQSPENRASTAKISFNYLGENLALAPDATTANNSLLASVEHRENIELPLFKKIGIGCVDLGNGEKIFVEEFSN